MFSLCHHLEGKEVCAILPLIKAFTFMLLVWKDFFVADPAGAAEAMWGSTSWSNHTANVKAGRKKGSFLILAEAFLRDF